MKKLLVLLGVFGILLSIPSTVLAVSTGTVVTTQSVWSKTKSWFIKAPITSTPVNNVVQPIAPTITKPSAKATTKLITVPVKKSELKLTSKKQNRS